MPQFKISSEFDPKGDQIRAIKELTEGLVRGDSVQTLMGATVRGRLFR